MLLEELPCVRIVGRGYDRRSYSVCLALKFVGLHLNRAGRLQRQSRSLRLRPGGAGPMA